MPAVADEIDLGLIGSSVDSEHDESWIDGPIGDISVADVLADSADDDEDDDDQDDDAGDEEDDGDAVAGEQDDEDDDDQDDDEEDDEDDTPLGESMPTDVGGGLDPAVEPRRGASASSASTPSRSASSATASPAATCSWCCRPASASRPATRSRR